MGQVGDKSQPFPLEDVLPGVCFCPAGLPCAKKGPWHHGCNMPRRCHGIVAGHAEGPQGPPYQTTVTEGAAGPGAPSGSDLEVCTQHQGDKEGQTGGDRHSYSSSPPHSFSRAFLYSPEVSSWKDRQRWRTMWPGGSK